MKVIFTILFLVAFGSFGQVLNGTVVDAKNVGIPGVKVNNKTQHTFSRTDNDGSFSIGAKTGDLVVFAYHGFDTSTVTITIEGTSMQQTIVLIESAQNIDEVNVIRKRMEDFDVGFLPPVKGVQIYTGTNAVIELANLNGAKSSANPREIFAKVPGLNIWESDGAGIQMGIGGRGLSPDRTANFNTRQNGYDISADALGYPESYYTPPLEGLKSIEIIRGSASLQFGTQFGGLLNFIIKDPPTNTPLEITTRNTGGMYGYPIRFQIFNQFLSSIDNGADNLSWNQTFISTNRRRQHDMVCSPHA